MPRSPKVQIGIFVGLSLTILFLFSFAVVSVKEEQPASRQSSYKSFQSTPKGENHETFRQCLTKDAAAFFTFVLALLTAILAAVSVFQIYYLRRADKTARRSVKASLRQARVAENALIASQRAWLSVEEVRIVQGSSFDESVCELQVSVIAKHHGVTPALSVSINIDMICINTERDLKSVKDSFLSKLDSLPARYVVTIFPGDTFKNIVSITYQVNATDVPEQKLSFIFLIGITYLIVGDEKRHIIFEDYSFYNIPFATVLGEDCILQKRAFTAGSVT